MRLILIIGFLLISRPCLGQAIELTEAEQQRASKYLDPAARKYMEFFLDPTAEMKALYMPPFHPGEVGIFMPRIHGKKPEPHVFEWTLKVNKIIDDQNAIVCNNSWLEGCDTSEWEEGQIIDWCDGKKVNRNNVERAVGAFTVLVVVGEPVDYVIDGKPRKLNRFIRVDTDAANELLGDIAHNRGYGFYLRESGWSWNQWPLIAKEVNRDFDKVTLETIKGTTLEKTIVEFEEKYKKQD